VGSNSNSNREAALLTQRAQLELLSQLLVRHRQRQNQPANLSIPALQPSAASPVSLQATAPQQQVRGVNLWFRELPA